MRSLSFVFAIGFLISCQAHNKEHKIIQSYRKGTLLLAATGTDGIIIAADSRFIWGGKTADGDCVVSCYIDSCQKIFMLKKYPLAIAGINWLLGPQNDTLDFVDLTNKFNRVYKGDTSCVKNFNSFLDVIYQKFEKRNSFLIYNTFITGGYVNGEATLIKEGYHQQILRVDTVFTSDKNSERVLFKYINKPYKKISCKKLQEIFIKVFKEYTLQDPLVGGPISMIMIDKNNSVKWLQNNFSDKPDGQDTPHFIGPKDTSRFNNAFRAVLCF